MKDEIEFKLVTINEVINIILGEKFEVSKSEQQINSCIEKYTENKKDTFFKALKNCLNLLTFLATNLNQKYHFDERHSYKRSRDSIFVKKSDIHDLIRNLGICTKNLSEEKRDEFNLKALQVITILEEKLTFEKGQTRSEIKAEKEAEIIKFSGKKTYDGVLNGKSKAPERTALEHTENPEEKRSWREKVETETTYKIITDKKDGMRLHLQKKTEKNTQSIQR